jgi:acetyl-CoA acetyltransferase
MASTLGCSAAIVGIGRAITKREDTAHKTALQLGALAASQAFKDAGIERRQIGALFTARCPSSYRTLQYNQTLLNELKIAPSFNSEVTSHGAGALGTLELAVMAINSGMVDYALCVTNEASGAWFGRAQVGKNAAGESNLQFEAPYGPTTPSLYAQVACRYLHEYGIKQEHMAKVAVENRLWALKHPHAAMRNKGPITVEDVMESRVIASPLKLLDCAVNYPGGIGTAIIVARADLAKKHHKNPTWIAGFGQCATHEWISERMGVFGVDPVGDEPNLTQLGVQVAAKQAYEMSGLKPKDIQMVQSSAPFSFVHLMVLEELGFCKKGEGGDYVWGGAIDYDGGMPFNTNGGYLSFGQVAQGLYNLQETIDQMWGRAEGRQVPDISVGLVHGHGGVLAAHSVMIVTKESTR